MSLVLTERQGNVEVVSVNRPEKRNALNAAVIQELHNVVSALEENAGISAVVLKGEGQNFVAGADIGELKERGLGEALASINGSLMTRWASLPMPTIAAVEGYALGGGCELALACDLRVAGESTVMGQPEVGLGIIPGAGATYRLPQVVGMAMAKELIFTGRLVSSREALAMGLVNKVVPDPEVFPEAMTLAQKIARQGARAVRLAKLVLNAQAGGQGLGGSLERLAQGILFESADKRSRMEAFLAKQSKRD